MSGVATVALFADTECDGPRPQVASGAKYSRNVWRFEYDDMPLRHRTTFD
jgi:hypothetical protein